MSVNGTVPHTTIRQKLKDQRAKENPMTYEAVMARPIDEAKQAPQVRDEPTQEEIRKLKPGPIANPRAFIDALRDEEIEWGGLGPTFQMVPSILLRSNGVIALNRAAMRALGIPAAEPKGYPIRAGLMAHGTIMVIEPVDEPEQWTPRINKAGDFQPGIDLMERAWTHGRYTAVVDDRHRRLYIRRDDWSPPMSGRRPHAPRTEPKPVPPVLEPRRSKSGMPIRGNS